MQLDLFFVIIPIVLYIVIYFRNEDIINKFDEKMNNFLTNKNDTITIKKIKQEKLSVNKALILLNRFYETNDPEYIAYALKNYLFKSLLLLSFIFGISLSILFVLFKYLFWNIILDHCVIFTGYWTEIW